jgi:hypothetical protein
MHFVFDFGVAAVVAVVAAVVEMVLDVVVVVVVVRGVFFYCAREDAF